MNVLRIISSNISMVLLLCSMLSVQVLAQTEKDIKKQVHSFFQKDNFALCVKIVKEWKTESLSDKQLIMDELFVNLGSKENCKLKNLADVTVESRIRSGEMEFSGHGLLLRQDVFIYGGKAAWALEMLIGVSLPAITEELSDKIQKERIQNIHECIQAYKNGIRDTLEENKSVKNKITLR